MAYLAPAVHAQWKGSPCSSMVTVTIFRVWMLTFQQLFLKKKIRAVVGIFQKCMDCYLL